MQDDQDIIEELTNEQPVVVYLLENVVTDKSPWYFEPCGATTSFQEALDWCASAITHVFSAKRILNAEYEDDHNGQRIR